MAKLALKTRVSTRTALLISTGLIALGGLAYGFVSMNLTYGTNGSFIAVKDVASGTSATYMDHLYDIDASKATKLIVKVAGTLDTSGKTIKVELNEVTGTTVSRTFTGALDLATKTSTFDLMTDKLGKFSYYARIYDSATNPAQFKELWKKTDGSGSLLINIYNPNDCGKYSYMQSVNPSVTIPISGTGYIAVALKNETNQLVPPGKTINLYDATTKKLVTSATTTAAGGGKVNVPYSKTGPGTHTYYAVCDTANIMGGSGAAVIVAPQLTFMTPPCITENNSLGPVAPDNFNQCCVGLTENSVTRTCIKLSAGLTDINEDGKIDIEDQKIADFWKNGGGNVVGGYYDFYQPDGKRDTKDAIYVTQQLTYALDFDNNGYFDQADIDMYTICRPNVAAVACTSIANAQAISRINSAIGADYNKIQSKMWPSMIKNFDFNGDGKVMHSGPTPKADLTLFGKCSTGKCNI